MTVHSVDGWGQKAYEDKLNYPIVQAHRRSVFSVALTTETHSYNHKRKKELILFSIQVCSLKINYVSTANSFGIFYILGRLKVRYKVS